MPFFRPALLILPPLLAGCAATPVAEAPKERLIVPTTPTVSARIEVYTHLPAEVDRSSWTFLRLGDLVVQPSAKGPVARLDLQDGQMSGNTGCNGIFGSYQREDTRLQFTGAGISRRFCANLDEQEKRVLDVLSRTRYGMYAKWNRNLLLLDERREIIAELAPAAPEDAGSRR
ncbi:MAG TPA: META domain-containing protein [Fluviicoccus sp.]|nr:META domain-containing protein [Fluviicoccus sp.]